MFTSTSAVSHPARKKTKNFSTLHVNFAILAFIIFFGVAYLVQISSLSTKGYEIRQMEQTIKKLSDQQKHLELQSSNLQSITRIQQAASKMNLVPVGQTAFISDSDFALR